MTAVLLAAMFLLLLGAAWLGTVQERRDIKRREDELIAEFVARTSAAMMEIQITVADHFTPAIKGCALNITAFGEAFRRSMENDR